MSFSKFGQNLRLTQILGSLIGHLVGTCLDFDGYAFIFAFLALFLLFSIRSRIEMASSEDIKHFRTCLHVINHRLSSSSGRVPYGKIDD